MYEFLWTILHPHWLTAFQKNTLVYWFVINFSERWRKSPRETRHSGCVERAKFWKLTGIHGGRSTPKKVHPRNLICRLCREPFESRHLTRVFGRASKKEGGKEDLSSKIRNVCGIDITESDIPSRRLYAGSAMDLCPRGVTSDKGVCKCKYSWNNSVQWSVV